MNLPSRRTVAVVPALLAAAWTVACVPEPADGGRRALALAAEFQNLAAARDYWPGFDPIGIPLAVYDGDNTYLFRHPAPPPGFLEVPDSSPAATVFQGRHEAMVANSSAVIGGVATATVLLDGVDPDRDLIDLAALTLHESFHVYQVRAHPGWGGNEADALTFPVEDAGLLALRRRETAALRHAFEAGYRDRWECWAAHALESRRRRYGGMEPAFAAYERGIELSEGLATYVQDIALNRMRPELPEGGFPAASVRARAYETGVALALLLDRSDPEWRSRTEASENPVLDLLLADRLDDDAGRTCGFSDGEIAGFEADARRDAGALLAERVKMRDEFEARPGWRLVIEADPGDPLWPRGFDPLNMKRVENGVLHTRFVDLGNDRGGVKILDATSLTEAAGPHPLFTGVRRVVLTGLAEAPEITESDGAIRIDRPGLVAEFDGARVERSGNTVTIRLGEAPQS